MRKVQLTIKQEEVAPATTSDLVVMNNGKTLKEELSTNVLDKFSREVTVVSSMEKVADGVYDGPYESLVFNGKTLKSLIDFKGRFQRTTGTLVERTQGTITFTTSGTGKFNLGCKLQLKPNTKYLLRAKTNSAYDVNMAQ